MLEFGRQLLDSNSTHSNKDMKMNFFWDKLTAHRSIPSRSFLVLIGDAIRSTRNHT